MVPESRLSLKWGDAYPWGAGEPGHAVGHYDQICINTFDAAGFSVDFNSLKDISLHNEYTPIVENVCKAMSVIRE